MDAVCGCGLWVRFVVAASGCGLLVADSGRESWSRILVADRKIEKVRSWRGSSHATRSHNTYRSQSQTFQRVCFDGLFIYHKFMHRFSTIF